MLDWAWGSMRVVGGADTTSPADFARFLGAIHDAGVRWIDCADIYARGEADSAVGQALAHDPALRERFKLIAKAGVVLPGGDVTTQNYTNEGAYLRRQLEGSLKGLGVDQVDLFLVHRPDYLMDAADTAAALKTMIGDGLTKAVGVSNFSVWQSQRLNAALGAPVAADQLELSPLATEALDDGRLDTAMTNGTDIFAWSPLAGGQLFNPESEAARRTRSALAQIAGGDDDDVIAGAALAWVAHHPSRPIPILGSTRLDRTLRQVEAMNAIRFSTEDWYAVLEASRGVRVP